MIDDLPCNVKGLKEKKDLDIILLKKGVKCIGDVVNFCRETKSEAWELPMELKHGIYSNHQAVLSWILNQEYMKVENDYPFELNLISSYISILLNSYEGLEDGSPIELDIDKIESDAAKYKKILRIILYLRELIEEGEALSIELVLSHNNLSQSKGIELKKLAQVFGRGIALSNAIWYDGQRDNIYGTIKKVYFNNIKTPQSQLYPLEKPFDHLNPDEISITLKRDGVISIAEKGNPLLEFYNGSWNLVDLSSATSALDSLIKDNFPNATRTDMTSRKLIHLAYHLATHWHGAIISLRKKEERLEDILFMRDNSEIDNEVIDQIKKFQNTIGQDNEKIRKDGEGRLLLSVAIQDGAVIFNEDGEYLRSGSFVKEPSLSSESGGSRKAASRRLGKNGIAIHISQDGNVILFNDDCEIKIR